VDESWGLLWTLWALLLAGAIAAVSLGAAKLWARRRERRTNSLITHAVMAVLSVTAMAWLCRGQFAEFGFSVGTFRWSFLMILWAVPMALLTLPQVLGRRSEPSASPFHFTPTETVVRVWLVASVAEEILTRGLIQSSLVALSDVGLSVRAHFVSLPVLIGAVAFSAMHLVLLKRMGARVAPVLVVTFLLGCIAGVYREAAGSLIPAVAVHVLFNVGGTIPVWVAQAVRARRASGMPGGREEG